MKYLLTTYYQFTNNLSFAICHLNKWGMGNNLLNVNCKMINASEGGV